MKNSSDLLKIANRGKYLSEKWLLLWLKKKEIERELDRIDIENGELDKQWCETFKEFKRNLYKFDEGEVVSK